MPRLFTAVLFVVLSVSATLAEPFDPYLHQKALDYDAWISQWHTTGLGGSHETYFTDETRTQMQKTGGQGDSTDWTTFYMVSQCLRYRITGEETAVEEVERIAAYLHLVHTVTQHPGYIARYVGLDQPPWNVETMESDARYEGTSEFEGLFWIGQQSRDKFMHWFWGMSWAFDTIRDEDLKQTIAEDMERIARQLREQDWVIIDPFGETWAAADLGADIRMEIMLTTAHVTGDLFWWNELDKEFAKMVKYLPITMNHFFNRYFDYYAFINDAPVSNAVFRLWPDKLRLEQYFDAWYSAVRQYTIGTHEALFDVIYYGACRRLGVCDPAEVEYLRRDVTHGLTVFWSAPNYQRFVECPELPLDPFSVWAVEVVRNNPWIDELINIELQTKEAHTVENRCWSTHLWEVKPYHVSCHRTENKAYVAPGYDFTLAYWFGVYYGLLPGDGPYDDGEFYDPYDDGQGDDDYQEDDDQPDPGDADDDYDRPPAPSDDSSGGDGCS